MSSALTDAYKNRLLDWGNGVGSPTRPSTPLKVLLYTTMPNQQTGLGGVEVSGFAYARTTVVFSAAATGATSNTGNVIFPTASGGNWGSIVGIGIIDNASLLMLTIALPIARTINDGQVFDIPSGAITQVF